MEYINLESDKNNHFILYKYMINNILNMDPCTHLQLFIIELKLFFWLDLCHSRQFQMKLESSYIFYMKIFPSLYELMYFS
jgi:hypothetical protein